MEGTGSVLGFKAPNFSLKDQTGKVWTLPDAIQESSALLVFYPGDFTPVCTKQLCNYRDATEEFHSLGVRVVGISPNSIESHTRFSMRYEFAFPLLSDPEQRVAKEYGCISWLMLGAVSRAICIVNQRGLVLYRYVEPTTFTRRKSVELLGILRDLKANSLI